MSKLLRQNIGGTDFTMVGCTLTGTCSSAASDYIKTVTLTDGDILSDGMTVVVAFTNGNTAGTAPASMTIYSSDQVNYYEDDQLTVPFTLAPEGCYEIEYTGTGNAYSYISYPIMQVGSISGPICNASGNKASGALWLAGDKVSVNYSNGCFNVIPQATDSMTVMAASSVVNGAPLRAGSTVRIMFTADLAGTDTVTGLVLNYNGVNTSVKVGKNGSLSNFVASEVSTGVYKYLQAYTTLELAFDGTQFIIIGNPVVLSSADYTIYADGNGRTNVIAANNLQSVTSNAVAQRFRNTQFDLINHEIDYFSQTVQFDCNVYLNTNIEIVAPIAQFSNYPSQISQSGYSPLIGWLVSRGENLIHDYDLRNMRNIQEFTAIFFNGSGWQCSKYRRFAIDETLFPWAQVN